MSHLEPNSFRAFDVQSDLSELLEKVEAGEEVIITRHGMPVARMAPVKRGTTTDERRAAIARWTESARGLSLGELTFDGLVNEGRR
jgi:prevent-host-death family protein